LSNGKAKTERSVVDELLKLKKERAKNFGLARKQGSVSNVVIGTSGSKGGSEQGKNDHIKTRGD